MLVHFLEIYFAMTWFCKFDIIENNFFIAYDYFYININASEYDNTLFSLAIF